MLCAALAEGEVDGDPTQLAVEFKRDILNAASVRNVEDILTRLKNRDWMSSVAVGAGEESASACAGVFRAGSGDARSSQEPEFAFYQSSLMLVQRGVYIKAAAEVYSSRANAGSVPEAARPEQRGDVKMSHEPAPSLEVDFGGEDDVDSPSFYAEPGEGVPAYQDTIGMANPMFGNVYEV